MRTSVGRCAAPFIEGPSLMRWVLGYEGAYLIHRDGYVVNRLARTMTTKIDRYGYANVRLNRSGEQRWKKVHRLVCEAWRGPCPDGHECGHLDGDRLNNQPENLVWVTRKENTEHKRLQGRPHGGGRGTALSPETLKQIRCSPLSSRRAATEFGVSKSHVVRIRNGVNCAGEAK